MDHPLVKHKLTYVRSISTESWHFRDLINEITYLMLYESTRNLTTRTKRVQTPLAMAKCQVMEEEIIVVPILRAGLGMMDGFLRLVPMAKVGYIGLYRDEDSLEPVEYYCKVPDPSEATVFVLDPMLATGGSVSAAITMLKKQGAKRIKFMSILAAPEGIKALQNNHPDVKIFTANIDKRLNENGYIMPGIGDCGDRLYFTP